MRANDIPLERGFHAFTDYQEDLAKLVSKSKQKGADKSDIQRKSAEERSPLNGTT
jgi:hypothetical protein